MRSFQYILKVLGLFAPLCLFTFTLVFPTILVFMGNNAGAGIVAGVGLACLLFLRLEDVSEFAGFGVKAKLEKTLKEAEVTVERLRALSVALAKPIVSQIALNGQIMTHLTTEFISDTHSDVISALKSLGASKQQLADVDVVWRSIWAKKILILIKINFQKHAQGPALKELQDIEEEEINGEIVWRIEKVISKFKIKDAELTELLRDLEVMLRDGIVRRPEKYLSNMSVR